MRASRLLIVLLTTWAVTAHGAGALNNCATGGKPRPDEGGIGGTGARPAIPAEGGIGGTGAHPDGIGGTGVSPGGIGGTGLSQDGIGGTGMSASADTGIIGTITGFGSICVGGVEVHYSSQTPIEVDGRTATVAELGIGQVVEVVAGGTGDEVQARSIVLRHLVRGPVQRQDVAGNEIEVLGQTIQLSAATRTGDDVLAVSSAFPLNSYVAVSGSRRVDGIVVASRITSLPLSETVLLSGPVAQGAGSTLAVAGVAVNLSDSQNVHSGDEVRVAGRWDGSVISADSLETISQLPFNGRVGMVDIEGYAHSSLEAGRIFVGPFQVEVSTSTLTNNAAIEHAESYVRLRAVVRDRHVIVERIAVVGDMPPIPTFPDHAPGWVSHGPSDPEDGHQLNWGSPDQSHGDGGHGAPPPSLPGGGDGSVHPPDISGGSPPSRPDHPWIPNPPAIPDFPGLPDRPQRPERPNSDRPSYPDRPNMERPPMPDMPDMHRTTRN